MGLQIAKQVDLTKLELKSSDFNKIRSVLYDYCGIDMHEGKEALVKARVLKRLRMLKMTTFKEYFDYMESDASGAEFLALVDVLTTNKTSFFRESAHFDFIRSEVIPKIHGQNVTWWSAGCSSGEEPVSWAITYLEEKKKGFNGSARILATDISSIVLQKAKRAMYSKENMEGMPDIIRRDYFMRSPMDPDMYQVKENVRSMIRYGRLNLKEAWPMKGPFHIIMCRNVMIYFDRPTQSKLVDRFCDLLAPGGYLFLGHSESISGSSHGLKNIKPAVYQKK
ncbi:protein-glutamate O-methyltransferase CheR [Balneolaceae bacterium ANBcel3]|nr:protein-glutamate O-methyltransferase CheR [Balneolaceae bacterium ANBcel3]